MERDDEHRVHENTDGEDAQRGPGHTGRGITPDGPLTETRRASEDAVEVVESGPDEEPGSR
jgi:hypothetical protein